MHVPEITKKKKNLINQLSTGHFYALLSTDLLLKKHSFITVRVTNILFPGQARRFVGSDQSLSLSPIFISEELIKQNTIYAWSVLLDKKSVNQNNKKKNIRGSKSVLLLWCFVCLVLFFTTKSTIFQLCRDRFSWVEPVLGKDNCVLLKDTTQ